MFRFPDYIFLRNHAKLMQRKRECMIFDDKEMPQKEVNLKFVRGLAHVLGIVFWIILTLFLYPALDFYIDFVINYYASIT